MFTFNQKMAQNDPEKNIPSTAAKATSLSPNELYNNNNNVTTM
jgi:hypothetical protein